MTEQNMEVHPESIADEQKPQDINSPEHVTLTTEKLNLIKQDILKLINKMTENPSLFSKAAMFWGELSLWKKILAGLVLTIPTLMLGVLAHDLLLLSLSIVSVVIFISSYFTLQNHYNQIVSNSGNLKLGVISFADTLGLLSQTLGVLNEQLVKSIEEFEVENKKMEGQISRLTLEIPKLTQQSQHISNEEIELRAVVEAQKLLAVQLELLVQQQAALFKQAQQQLEQTLDDLTKSEENLDEKCAELAQVKMEFFAEIEKLNAIKLILDTSITTFRLINAKEGAEKALSQERLNVLLTDGETDFGSISATLFQMDLEKTIARIKCEIAKYNEYLLVFIAKVARLKGIAPGVGYPSENGFFSGNAPVNQPHLASNCSP